MTAPMAEVIPLQSFEQADSVAAAFLDLSWRQGPAYGRAAARYIGAASMPVKIAAGDRPIGYAEVRIKYLPLTRWGIAQVSHGPTIGGFDADRFVAALQALRRAFCEFRGLVLRIETRVVSDTHPEVIDRLLRANGFRRTAAEQETIVIDLTPAQDVLRSNLHGKWRTDLSRAERSGVSVRTASDERDFEQFDSLLQQLQQRKGFRSPQPMRVFHEAWRDQARADHLRLLLAVKDGAVIAGHLGAYSGDTAVYVLGAADAIGRELRAAYLLQWTAMQYAKARGQTWYDLGGIDEQANPDVFRFKNRMGGRRVHTSGRYEYAPATIGASAVRLAEALRSRWARSVRRG